MERTPQRNKPKTSLSTEMNESEANGRHNRNNADADRKYNTLVYVCMCVRV